MIAIGLLNALTYAEYFGDEESMRLHAVTGNPDVLR